jgi:pimeloyl-ACP methyl ester carboxylesterase
MKVVLAVVLTAVVVAATGVVEPAVALDFCRAEDRDCGVVEVPLDRSGAMPGTVRLHVELERAENPTAAPLLAIAGAPGQASTEVLSLMDLSFTVGSDEEDISRERLLSPSRDIAIMDLRGTGGSGALRCDALQRSAAMSAKQGAACAATLGASRGLYTARDSADDVEAVRRAIGAEKIALLGTSYGARVALAYAQRHPGRVDRLLLQSPPAPNGSDLLYRSAFAMVPQLVATRCGGGACRRASRSPVSDVNALAKRLERGPIRGSVATGSGRRRAASLTGFALFQFLQGFFADDSQLPGFVRNARKGDVVPLLRALQILGWYRGVQGRPDAVQTFSVGAYAASVCEESDLPWPRDGAVTDRAAYMSNLVAGLPLASFAPFGPRTALGSDLIELCREWPTASVAPEAPGPLQAIPTLVVANKLDLTAPLSEAEAVARLIPGSRLMTVSGYEAGSVKESGSCVANAVRTFFEGADPQARCEYAARERMRAVPPPPLSLAELRSERGMRGRVGRTLAAVRLTLRDGASLLAWRFFARLLTAPENESDKRLARRLYGTPVRVGGLRAGAYRLGFGQGRYVLRAASYVPGVAVTGVLGPPGGHGTRRGHLRIHGPAAAHGRLVLRGPVLSGKLGGRAVRLGIGPSAFPDVSYGD